ncbi:citrate lyase acyl carrier protein [Dendrosporobacter sp. 1207_IL3150]|uniref:citrate lyase acyl carrier protein n=1 Tax=Dendrosporobacter sp. 1207_IL3150 TaxID=3084054 RepID=UPI002FD9DD8E
MSSLIKTAQAGTLESGDIMITIAPATTEGGVLLDLDSIVLAQYGTAIRKTILDIISELGVTDIYIKAVDRGALDCTIKARTLTALGRAGVVCEGELL